jgi:Nodulation protein Z (NodZ)
MDFWYEAYQQLKLRVAPLVRGGVFSVEINSRGIGLFAQLTWCTEVLEYCEQRGLKAQLSATSPNYRDPSRSPNWLSYFFEIADLIPQVDFCISEFGELRVADRYLKRRTIESTSELVSRNMPLKKEIRNQLDGFCREHFDNEKVLGIHYRGTDKTDEAPRVSWKLMHDTVSNYLQANSEVARIFVASDEPLFEDYIKDSFTFLQVIASTSGFEANYKADLGTANYKKGEEALLDCLLLSRCSALIRTTSFLSAWASIFNPALPIVVLNRPYPDKLWFPESLLLPRSMNQYVAEDATCLKPLGDVGCAGADGASTRRMVPSRSSGRHV